MHARRSMVRTLVVFAVAFASAGLMTARVGGAEDAMVKITPLGSHDGDLCRNDRAILLEDPTGVRVLWDPGRTTDEDDPRLGEVHVILLSSVHEDHIGDAGPNREAPGTCAAPGASPAPQTTVAGIAAAKSSGVVAVLETTGFLGLKIQGIRGVATPGCPAAGLRNEMVVPRDAPCAGTLMAGGSRTVRVEGPAEGVRIAVVPAFHSNGLGAGLLDEPGVAPGTRAYGGPEVGFVVRFTNGLTVYLAGDTGMFGDMDTIVRRFYAPNLMVVNISDVFVMGPDEAAYATRELVQPATVMPSHTNEASTTRGVVNAGTRVERFIQQMAGSGIDVVVPLSGETREFDGSGRCANC